MDGAQNAEAGPSRPRPATSTAVPTPAFERWRLSMAQFTGLRSANEQKSASDEIEDPKKMERDWERCERWKTALMEKSPIIVFMLKHLKLSGCPFNADAIQCHPCPSTVAGGFSPDYGILLCQNRYFSKKHMEDTIAHELIHAFDHCKFNVNWMNLRHHACTEIRAANLSGDCRWTREVKRGFYSFNKQHQSCVKRRAVLSVMSNPSCKDQEMAEKAVNEVWESCFQDTRPFDDIY